jgi:hypothetical protein
LAKKIILYGLLAAAIGLIGYVYYEFSKEESSAVDPYSAVPANVGIVWEFKTGTSLQGYLPWIHEISSDKNELANIPFNPSAHWFHIMSTLDSLRVHNSLWNQVLMNSSVVLASTSQMRGDNWMLSIGLSDAVSETELMNQWFSNHEKRAFKNATIYKGDALQYARVNHCLVIATSNATMEDIVLRTEKQGLLTKELHFTTAREARSKDVPLHMYFPIEDGQWIQLDPAYHHDKLSIHGYAILNESSKSHMVLSDVGSGFEIVNVLPANTIMLDAYSYNSFEDGWNKHEAYYQKTDAGKFWSQAWKVYGDSCACDLNEILLSWRGNEWGTAVVPMTDSTTAKLMYVAVRDSLNALDMMSRILKSSDNEIHQLLMPQLLDRNKPQSIHIENNFVTQHRQFVFFAANEEELNVFSKSSSVLKSNNQFNQAFGQTNKEAGRFIYQVGTSAAVIPNAVTSVFPGVEFIAASIQPYTSTKYLVQLILPNTAIAIAETEVDKQEKTPIESTNSHVDLADAKSWSVINHNDQSKETLVQLEDGQFCLLDKNQKALWQRHIEGTVLGEITQVDALKNGKLQYAFTTEKELYIIDRTGKDLKGFPIKPSSSIVSPLHVADYDRDKKYRLLFATNNGMSNYSIDGSITTGWKSPSIAAAYITTFKIANEDFIFTADNTGAVQLLKRTGETKVKTSTVLTQFNGQKCIITPSNDIYDTSVTYTTQSGEVKTVSISK